jgi:MFS family permease
MAILHSFVVIGIISGYIFGAITVTLFEEHLGWRFAFMVQGYFMILIGLGFLCTENKALDIFSLVREGYQSRVEETRPKSFSNADGTP